MQREGTYRNCLKPYVMSKKLFSLYLILKSQLIDTKEKVEVESLTKQNIHAALLTYIKKKKKDQSDFTLTRKYK